MNRRVGPDVLAVAERRVVHSPLAVHPRPGARVGGALVAVALQSLGLLHEDHVQVLGEVLQRVPLFGELQRAGETHKARKLRRRDPHCRLLLLSVNDELAAHHRDVWIELGLRRVALARRMERVVGRVEAHVAHAGCDRVEQAFLPVGRHGLAARGVNRPLGVVGLGQVARSVEGQGVVGVERFVEHGPVLGAHHVERRPLAHLGERLLGERKLIAGALHRAVLKAGRAREIEDLPLLAAGRPRKTQREGRQSQGGGSRGQQEIATSHDVLLAVGHGRMETQVGSRSA